MSAMWPSYRGSVGAVTAEMFSSEQAPARVYRRRDWRDGGRTVKPWDEGVLAIALIIFGSALLIAAAIRGFDPAGAASTVANVVMLVGMLVAVAIAFARARPRPLLQLRAIDILYGVTFGLALRLLQGAMAVAAGDDGALPSYAAAQQEVGTAWLFADVGSFLLIAPAIEEFFFRAVLLVTAYSVIRRIAGRVPAVLTALTISTVAFVLTQAWTQGTSWEAWVTPMIVGLACSALVLCTGRIWGAVLVHFVFNASYVVLALIGTGAGELLV